MKIALPVWCDRISPVFDVAGQLLLADVADGQVIARDAHALTEAATDARIRRLVELGVNTLVCAGISQPLEAGLTDRGIRVVAWVCGNVEEVLAAFIAGRLHEERFAMPGCCWQRRQRSGPQGRMGGRGCQRGRRRGRKENP
jgi:predicted Fe-Mo cluster-binding NifX family protein